MSKLAEVSLERRDGVPVARIAGDIDGSNRHEVNERLTRDLDNVDYGLVVDLSAVGYLDSAGVTLLFSVAERLRDRQQELRLVVPDGARIGRVLEVVDVTSVAGLDRDVDDAVAAIRALA